MKIHRQRRYKYLKDSSTVDMWKKLLLCQQTFEIYLGFAIIITKTKCIDKKYKDNNNKTNKQTNKQTKITLIHEQTNFSKF